MTARIARSEAALPGGRDQQPGAPLPAGERVPEPEARHDEPDLLLGQARPGRRRPRRARAGPRPGTRRRRAGTGIARATGVELVQHEPLHGRVEEVGEREAERGPLRARGACERARTRAARRARRRRPGRRGGATGSARPARAGRTRPAGSDRRARRAARSARRRCPSSASGSPCAVDQTAWTMFPRSKRPGIEGACRSTASAAKPAAERRRSRSTARAAERLTASLEQRLASARRGRPRSRAPGRRRRPRLADSLGERRSPASRRTAAASASGSPGGTSRARLAVGEQLAGAGRVRRDERRSAGERLEGLVRDHARGLVGGAEDPERAAGAHGARSGSCSYSTQGDHSTFAGRAASTPRAGRSRRRGTGSRARARAASSTVSSPCRGISLPTKRAVNGSPALPAGPEEPLLRADEADRHLPVRGAGRARARSSAFASVSATTRSAERSAWRSTAESARAGSEPGRKRPRSSTSVSSSETSGLKTIGFPRAARRAAGRSRWPGIAHDHGVEALLRPPEQPEPPHAASRTAADGPAAHLCSRPSQTGTCRSSTSTPARRRQEITCALRG